MFDIKSLFVSQTADVEINDPRDTSKVLIDAKSKKPVTVTIKSKAHPDYRKAAIAYVEAVRAEGTTEELKQEAEINFLKAIIVSFNNVNVTADDLAKPELYWLKEQIDAIMSNVGHFLPK